ncbi:Gfo/Idh/MocA family protein [Pseudolysobacter antarcticus]|nr:Gfo/Idh/MocA family oxidoreductase [Pseudolysobacter antarcticus]
MNAAFLPTASVDRAPQPIGTAVIGVGYFGSLHAQKYMQLAGSRLVALIDPDPLTLALSEHLGVGWLQHIDDLPPEVRAVSVVTPVQSHFALTKALLERGLDVLLEKPITSTLEQAETLCRLAESTGCVLQIGHIERFNPTFIASRTALAYAQRIHAIRAGKRVPRIDAVDVVTDLMIHDLDMLLAALDCAVVAVSATGHSCDHTVIDHACAELTFANGCRAQLTASWGDAVEKSSAHRIDAELDRGEIWSLDFHQRTVWRKTSPSATPVAVHLPHIAVNEDELCVQLAAFLSASRRRSTPQVTARDGYAALELAYRIRNQILGCGA